MDARSVRLVDMLKGWQYLMCLQQISLFLCISIASSILYQCSCHPLRGLHPSCDGKGCSVPPTLSSFHPTSHLPTPPPSNSSLFIQTNREWCQESISGEVPNAESYLLPSSSPANQGSTFNSFNPKWTITAGFFSLITFQRGAGQAGVKRSKVSLAIAGRSSPPLGWANHSVHGICGIWFQRKPTGCFSGYSASALEVSNMREAPLGLRGKCTAGSQDGEKLLQEDRQSPPGLLLGTRQLKVHVSVSVFFLNN